MRINRKLILIKLNLILIANTPLNRSIPRLDQAYGWHLLFIWIFLQFNCFPLLILNNLWLDEALRRNYFTGIISFGLNLSSYRLLTISLVYKLEPTFGSLLSCSWLGGLRSQLLRSLRFIWRALGLLLVFLDFHQVYGFVVGCSRGLNYGLRNRLPIGRTLWRNFLCLYVVFFVFTIDRLLMLSWQIILFVTIICSGGRKRFHLVVWGRIIARRTTIHNDYVLRLWLVMMLVLLLFLVIKVVSLTLISTEIQLSNSAASVHLKSNPPRFLLSTRQGLLFRRIHWCHNCAGTRAHCIFASFLDFG